MPLTIGLYIQRAQNAQLPLEKDGNIVHKINGEVKI